MMRRTLACRPTSPPPSPFMAPPRAQNSGFDLYFSHYLAQTASSAGDDVTTEVALLAALTALGLSARDFRVLSLLGCGDKGAVFAAE
jgi:hypothetical protein